MFNIDDIGVIRGSGSNYTVNVEDRDTSSASATLKRGEVAKRNNANFALLVADGDPEQGTDILVGLITSESTETASADGTAEALQLLPSAVLRGRATTAANIDTAAELLGVIFDHVTFDVSSGAITIDEDEGDDPNVHGLVIIDGDEVNGTLDVLVHQDVVLGGAAI